MKINLDSLCFTPKQIAAIEKEFDAKYVCETCLKNSNGNWVNQPIAIFYQEKLKQPEHSHWFGLYWGGDTADTLMIVDASDVLKDSWSGVLDESTGEVYYSRYRHDFRELPGGGFIDGGKDYIRTSLENGKWVRLAVNVDKLEVVE